MRPFMHGDSGSGPDSPRRAGTWFQATSVDRQSRDRKWRWTVLRLIRSRFVRIGEREHFSHSLR